MMLRVHVTRPSTGYECEPTLEPRSGQLFGPVGLLGPPLSEKIRTRVSAQSDERFSSAVMLPRPVSITLSMLP